MGPTAWTAAVTFKERTVGGDPCTTTLTLATDLAPAGAEEAAAAANAAHATCLAEAGGRGVGLGGGGGVGVRAGMHHGRAANAGGSGGGGGAGEGAPHLSPALIKSALQKSVRRGRCVTAARATALLLAEHPAEVLRRLAVVALEDAVLHPSLPLVIFFMAAQAKGWALPGEACGAVVRVAAELAACSVKDPDVVGGGSGDEEGESETEGGGEGKDVDCEGAEDVGVWDVADGGGAMECAAGTGVDSTATAGKGGAHGEVGGCIGGRGIPATDKVDVGVGNSISGNEMKGESGTKKESPGTGTGTGTNTGPGTRPGGGDGGGGGPTAALCCNLAVASHGLTGAQAALVCSLLIRAHFGGMRGDLDMLRAGAMTWRRRFLSDRVGTISPHSPRFSLPSLSPLPSLPPLPWQLSSSTCSPPPPSQPPPGSWLAHLEAMFAVAAAAAAGKAGHSTSLVPSLVPLTRALTADVGALTRHARNRRH